MVSAPTPDVVALARRLYLEDVPVKDILARTGLRLGQLYRCLEGRYDDGSGIPPSRLPLRRAGVNVRQRIGTRAALVTRMWRTAERQLAEIEDRLRAAGLPLDERESNARTLAIVAKTLRELTAVDEAKRSRAKGRSKDNDDDTPPRNIEDLRRALADKLEAFVAERDGSVPDEAR